MNINTDELYAKEDIISNASCTTNCSALVTKVSNDSFDIECGLMAQNTVDRPYRKYWGSGIYSINIACSQIYK